MAVFAEGLVRHSCFAEKIREGEKLLKKHRDDTLRGVSLQKDDSMLEVKK